LRQSFLNGSLTRLLDPDTVLRSKIAEFVAKGDFGLASGPQADGSYAHFWHGEPIPPEEVAFENGVFLLTKAKAEILKKKPSPASKPQPTPPTGSTPPQDQTPTSESEAKAPPQPSSRTFRISGNVPPEIWNRLGTKVIPKLRTGADLRITVEFAVTVDQSQSESFRADLQQILQDLGLSGTVTVD
jgi:hypothetical protein